MKPQEYLLVKLAQEANEVAHRASKALLFGLDEVQVSIEGNPRQMTNKDRLVEELKDLLAVMTLLDLNVSVPTKEILSRFDRIRHYAKISQRNGILEGEV